MIDALIDGFLAKQAGDAKRESLHRKVDINDVDASQERGVVRKTTSIYEPNATEKDINEARHKKQETINRGAQYGGLLGLLPPAALAYYVSRKTPGGVLSKILRGVKYGIPGALVGMGAGMTGGLLIGGAIADKCFPKHLQPIKSRTDYFARSYEDPQVPGKSNFLLKDKFKKTPEGLRETQYNWDYDV